MWGTQRPKSQLSLGLRGSEKRTMERAGAEASPEENRAKTSLRPGPEDGQAGMNF